MRRFLVLTFVLLSSTLGVRAATACSCVGRVSVAEAVRQADLVLFGVVVREVDEGRYETQVEGTLKGALPENVTLGVWRGGAASCGTDLALGPILLATDKDLQVSSCSWRWTGPAARAELNASGLTLRPPTGPGRLVAAERGFPAAPEGEESPLPLWPAAILVGLLAVGIYAFRRGPGPDAP